MALSKGDVRILRDIVSRLITVAPTKPTEQKSMAGDFVKTVVTTLASGSVGALITVTVFAYQANTQQQTWERQNRIEYKTKIIAEKSEILRKLRQDLVRYADLDAQTGIEANMRLMRTAAGMAIPGANKEMLKELPEMMTPDQLKEHREIWSSILSTTLLVRVYFGEKISDELNAAINIVGNYPNNLIDPYQLAEMLKQEAAKGPVDLKALNDRLLPHMRPYPLPKGLFNSVLLQMVESIELDVSSRQMEAK